MIMSDAFTIFGDERMSDALFIDYVTTLVQLRDMLRIMRKGNTEEYAATSRLFDDARAEVIARNLAHDFDGIDADVFLTRVV